MTKCYICGKELKKNNYMVCTSVLTNFDQKPPVENICYSCFKKLNFKIILVNTTETNFFKKEFRKKKKKVK